MSGVDGVRPDAAEVKRIIRDAFVNKKALGMGCVGPFLMKVNGRYRLFEFHGVSGPTLLDPKGEPLDRQPAPSSDFWPKFDAWRKSGCHVDQNNRAYVPSARILSFPKGAIQ